VILTILTFGLTRRFDFGRSFRRGLRGGGGDDGVAPIAKDVFAALVLAGQHIARGGHEELQIAGRGGVRPDRVVAGLRGGLGLLVERVGQFVVGIGGGHLRAETGNTFDAIERAGRAELVMLGENGLSQRDEFIGIAGYVYAHIYG